MTWTLNQINEFLKRSSRERNDTRRRWNRDFPPDAEVVTSINDEDGVYPQRSVTYGIWKTDDGIFFIEKSKNGYHPEKRICLPEALVRAIMSFLNKEEGSTS